MSEQIFPLLASLWVTTRSSTTLSSSAVSSALFTSSTVKLATSPALFAFVKRSWRIRLPLMSNFSSRVKRLACDFRCSMSRNLFTRSDARYLPMSFDSMSRTSRPSACRFTASCITSFSRLFDIDLIFAMVVCSSPVVIFSCCNRSLRPDKNVTKLDNTIKYCRKVSGFKLKLENQQTLLSSCSPNLVFATHSHHVPMQTVANVLRNVHCLVKISFQSSYHFKVPVNIRASGTLSMFTKCLKTYLFIRHFN